MLCTRDRIAPSIQRLEREIVSANLDGWSSLVMIPVSHTGGREFKSLPIHFNPFYNLDYY
jgi:hypothetical protein